MPLIIVIQRLWNVICLGCPSNGECMCIYMYTAMLLNFEIMIHGQF